MPLAPQSAGQRQLAKLLISAATREKEGCLFQLSFRRVMKMLLRKPLRVLEQGSRGKLGLDLFRSHRTATKYSLSAGG